MTQTINPDRLKHIRSSRRLTQEGLADAAKMSKQTIHRIENGKAHGKNSLKNLARALDVDVEVLTGERPIPSDAGQTRASPDETDYQLNIRVDASIRNAFELAAHRYGVSVTKIARLAPLLFTIVAEKSFQYRRKKLEEYEHNLSQLVELAANLPHVPGCDFYSDDLEVRQNSIAAEKASIADSDLFGLRGFDPFRNYDRESSNPFRAYIDALVGDRENIVIHAIGPTSTGYRVCISEAHDLAEGDEQLQEAILNGEVPIHRMPRGLKTCAERTAWMQQNKISAQKIQEQLPGEFLEEDSGILLSLDTSDLDIKLDEVKS